VQNPNVLLMILSSMAQKPHVKFEKLYPKLYNTELWVMAYEKIAAHPGNMTPGMDRTTIDGTGMERIEAMIADLKASRYSPKPARRTYLDKPNGGKRPIGIPCFMDKLLQTVIKFILEAIYEPTFSLNSHGFRPNRSCHTALEQVKRLVGVRWWVEGDIKGFFDTLDHDILLRLLAKRITDNRFLHLIGQLLRAGYIENWIYHQTYSGTPQGSSLSPILSNIYLNELDQKMEDTIRAFNQGEERQKRQSYLRVKGRKKYAKKKARQTGDWTTYKALQKQQLSMEAADPQDPTYRRMYYIRYADDFLIGIIGSKADATATKGWLTETLKTQLNLELSERKTLITNAKERVRFLGYEIRRWQGTRILRFPTTYGTSTKRTCTQHLKLLMPTDKTLAFVRTYGNDTTWRGERRASLTHLSELEILLTYNAEIRGFLNYYALADNFSRTAAKVMWVTSTSFFKTLANKRQSSLYKVAKSLKRGAATYVIDMDMPDGTTRSHRLLSSTRQFQQQSISYARVDFKPYTWKFQSRSELGQRLRANECEWCGTQTGIMQVHHIKKLKDLKGKSAWEIQMISRKRKTMVLCKQCHVELHAGRLKEPRTERTMESRIHGNV